MPGGFPYFLFLIQGIEGQGAVGLVFHIQLEVDVVGVEGQLTAGPGAVQTADAGAGAGGGGHGGGARPAPAHHDAPVAEDDVDRGDGGEGDAGRAGGAAGAGTGVGF